MNGQIASLEMSQRDFNDTIEKLGTLKLIGLKAVSRTLGTSQAGTKAQIVERIQHVLNTANRRREFAKVQTIRVVILKAKNGEEMPTYDEIIATFQTNTLRDPTQRIKALKIPARRTQKTLQWVNFKPTVFFTSKRLIRADGSENPKIAFKEEAHRATTRMHFQLTADEIAELKANNNRRLFLLSGVINEGKPNTEEQYLEFPQPNEIVFNDVKITISTKGIKGKEGSVKPADLTFLVKYYERNYLDVIYAYTKSDYLLYLYIVEVTPVEELYQRILDHSHISKQTTLDFIKEQRQQDDDVQTSKEIVSLNCPCSFVKMEKPCKSVKCQHVQCFDAWFFMELQVQAPTWLCPVCSRKLELEDLAIDDYFQEVIDKTTADDETIEIDENGAWHVRNEEYNGESDTSQPSAPVQSKIEQSEKRLLEAANDSVEVINLDSDEEVEEEAPIAPTSRRTTNNSRSVFTPSEMTFQQPHSSTSTEISIDNDDAIIAPSTRRNRQTIGSPSASRTDSPGIPSEVLELVRNDVTKDGQAPATQPSETTDNTTEVQNQPTSGIISAPGDGANAIINDGSTPEIATGTRDGHEDDEDDDDNIPLAMRRRESLTTKTSTSPTTGASTPLANKRTNLSSPFSIQPTDSNSASNEPVGSVPTPERNEPATQTSPPSLLPTSRQSTANTSPENHDKFINRVRGSSISSQSNNKSRKTTAGSTPRSSIDNGEEAASLHHAPRSQTPQKADDTVQIRSVTEQQQSPPNVAATYQNVMPPTSTNSNGSPNTNVHTEAANSENQNLDLSLERGIIIEGAENQSMNAHSKSLENAVSPQASAFNQQLNQSLTHGPSDSQAGNHNSVATSNALVRSAPAQSLEMRKNSEDFQLVGTEKNEIVKSFKDFLVVLQNNYAKVEQARSQRDEIAANLNHLKENSPNDPRLPALRRLYIEHCDYIIHQLTTFDEEKKKLKLLQNTPSVSEKSAISPSEGKPAGAEKAIDDLFDLAIRNGRRQFYESKNAELRTRLDGPNFAAPQGNVQKQQENEGQRHLQSNASNIRPYDLNPQQSQKEQPQQQVQVSLHPQNQPSHPNEVHQLPSHYKQQDACMHHLNQMGQKNEKFVKELEKQQSKLKLRDQQIQIHPNNFRQGPLTQQQSTPLQNQQYQPLKFQNFAIQQPDSDRQQQKNLLLRQKRLELLEQQKQSEHKSKTSDLSNPVSSIFPPSQNKAKNFISNSAQPDNSQNSAFSLEGSHGGRTQSTPALGNSGNTSNSSSNNLSSNYNQQVSSLKDSTMIITKSTPPVLPSFSSNSLLHKPTATIASVSPTPPTPTATSSASIPISKNPATTVGVQGSQGVSNNRLPNLQPSGTPTLAPTGLPKQYQNLNGPPSQNVAYNNHTNSTPNPSGANGDATFNQTSGTYHQFRQNTKVSQHTVPEVQPQPQQSGSTLMASSSDELKLHQQPSHSPPAAAATERNPNKPLLGFTFPNLSKLLNNDTRQNNGTGAASSGINTGYTPNQPTIPDFSNYNGNRSGQLQTPSIINGGPTSRNFAGSTSYNSWSQTPTGMPPTTPSMGDVVDFIDLTAESDNEGS